MDNMLWTNLCTGAFSQHDCLNSATEGRDAGRRLGVGRQSLATTSIVIGNDTSLCNDAVTVC